jgi:hypothetical protein
LEREVTVEKTCLGDKLLHQAFEGVMEASVVAIAFCLIGWAQAGICLPALVVAVLALRTLFGESKRRWPWMGPWGRMGRIMSFYEETGGVSPVR